MYRRIARMGLALLISIFPAVAKDVKIGTSPVNLTSPLGFCELDDRKAYDARLITGMRQLQTQNLLLAMYADCQQLSDFRSGKRPTLNDYAQYTSPNMSLNANVPVDVIKQLCAKLRIGGDSALARAVRDRTLSISKVFEGTKLNETRSLGIVAEDSIACCWAAIQKVIAEDGEEKMPLTVNAFVLIKGKIVQYQLSAPYLNGDTLATTLERHKANVLALVAANRN